LVQALVVIGLGLVGFFCIAIILSSWGFYTGPEYFMKSLMDMILQPIRGSVTILQNWFQGFSNMIGTGFSNFPVWVGVAAFLVIGFVILYILSVYREIAESVGLAVPIGPTRTARKTGTSIASTAKREVEGVGRGFRAAATGEYLPKPKPTAAPPTKAKPKAKAKPKMPRAAKERKPRYYHV